MQIIAAIIVVFVMYLAFDAIYSEDPHITINDTEVSCAVAQFIGKGCEI